MQGVQSTPQLNDKPIKNEHGSSEYTKIIVRFFFDTVGAKKSFRLRRNRIAKRKRRKEISPLASGDRPVVGGSRGAFEKAPPKLLFILTTPRSLSVI